MSEDGRPGMHTDGSDSRSLFVVGIGASAGGLEALREMLSAVSRDCALAFVVVQHLDPNHDSLLAELLGRHTTLDVRQAHDGETVQPGTVHIIPPGHGLSIKGRRLILTDFAQPRGLRRPIDDFFESLAEDQGDNAACVILSGTGADGSAGLRAIKEHGGLCVVQDPGTAKYDGMPTSAQSTGLVDFVLPPEEIIGAVQQFFLKTADGEGGQLARTVEETLGDICSVVRSTAGHDFSGYKTSTLARRVQRRIQVLDLPDATAYLHHIRSEPDECEVLFRELLINVTRFFRDPEHFETLRRQVVKPLVETSDSEEVRVWVPGCSSGEEAYSIAMLFAEEVRLQRRSIDIQVFATDIDERMLRIARDGIYPQAALADIPEDMRDLYTVARDGTFQVATRIRDMIRFSVHSLVRDPPFSNIDLLSCRNLLIYFDEELQASVLPIFHYSVRPGGKLFLGPSESLYRHEHLFHPIEPQARLFERNDARPEYPLQLRSRSDHRRARRRSSDELDGKATRIAWVDNAATERILEAYGPATLLVAAQGEVLGSTGKLGRYLDIPPGERTTRYAASIARPGVREAISSTVRQAVRTQRRTISRDLVATSELGRQPFDLIADPLKDGTVSLVFRERGRFDPLHEDDLDDVAPGDSHLQSLEDELRSTRARLHITVEELETANEELKSSNEEMMSMNEELQSTNEELATVNDELKDKVDELSVANADLSNFFASTALPLVVLDLDRRIRNFTGAIQSIYPLRPGDRGRPLAEMTCNIEDSDEILGVIETVIETEQEQRLQIQNHAEQRTWSLVVTPYRARNNQVEGVTLVFSELTDALQLEDDLRAEGERLRLALDVAELGVWELSRDGRHIHFDHTAAALLGLDADEMPLETFLKRVPEETRQEAAGTLHEGGTVLPFGLTFEQANGPHRERSVRMVGRRIARSQGKRTLGVIFDVTEAEEAKRVREIMLHEMNHRVKNLFSIISGMVRIAGMSAESVRDLVDGVTARIGALARSHNLTHHAPVGTALTLGDAVRSAIEPFDGHARIEVDGPAIEVSPETLTALSLLFHELATNAAKYGVLGPAEGRLSVTWRSGDRDEIQLDWVEHYDEPTVRDDNEMTGFGSTLMQMSAAQVDGRIDIERRPDMRRTRLTYERHD